MENVRMNEIMAKNVEMKSETKYHEVKIIFKKIKNWVKWSN